MCASMFQLAAIFQLCPLERGQSHPGSQAPPAVRDKMLKAHAAPSRQGKGTYRQHAGPREGGFPTPTWPWRGGSGPHIDPCTDHQLQIAPKSESLRSNPLVSTAAHSAAQEQQKLRVCAQVQWYPLVQQDGAFSSKVTQEFPSLPCNIIPLPRSLTGLAGKQAASLV